MIDAIIATIKTNHYNNIPLYYKESLALRAHLHFAALYWPPVGVSVTSTRITVSHGLCEALALLVPQCACVKLSFPMLIKRFQCSEAGGGREGYTEELHGEKT